MNKLLLIIFFCSTVIFGQTNDTTFVYGDSLNTKNIQIFKNWDYHSGDDSLWASPSFSSIGWQSVDCRLRRDSLINDEWKGIGWFRKTIVIDSALKNKTISITLNHYGASEFYLNGKLLNTFGKVSDSSETEEIFRSQSKPIIIRFDSSTAYLFSVRYSNHLPLDYGYLFSRLTNNLGFYATLKSIDSGINYYGVEHHFQIVIQIWLFGIFISISIIYFLLFLFYKNQKEYLYYALFTFSLSGILINNALESILTSNLVYYFAQAFTTPLFLLATFVSVIAFLHQIFYARMLKIFYVILIAAAVTLFSAMIEAFDDFSQFPFLAILLGSAIEIIRVIIISIKSKKNNAWLIGTGVGIFAFCILFLFALGLFDIKVFDPMYIVFVFLFSIPSTMSIYLAKSSAQTKKDLEIQLDSVKKLSAEAIENEKKTAKLELETQLVKIENERKTRELEEARNLQLSMLPLVLPKLQNLEIAVYMKTATEVGGDYYDFSSKIDGSLNICLGDATGHGMKAGTLVSMMKSLFTAESIKLEIEEFYDSANSTLKKMGLDKMMMAFAMININKEDIKIANAGIPPIYIFRNSKKMVEEINLNGMPIGAMKNFKYDVYESKVNAGDTILMLSDGMPELQNKNSEMYGYERLKIVFMQNGNKPSEEIISILKEESSNWVNENDPDDDITFVVIKIK